MITWYIRTRKLIDNIWVKAIDADDQARSGNLAAARTVAGYIKSDYQNLRDHWLSRYDSENFGNLGRHLHFGQAQDFNDIVRTDLPYIEGLSRKRLEEYAGQLPSEKALPYVSELRMNELLAIDTTQFDLSRLIAILRELNLAHNTDSFITIGILLRTIIDHIPPIFGQANFSGVANNYQGTRSFKGLMQRFEQAQRGLADSYLHTQIRSKESLPAFQQVDFRAELDALLAETTRILDN